VFVYVCIIKTEQYELSAMLQIRKMGAYYVYQLPALSSAAGRPG